jgi:putative transposase
MGTISNVSDTHWDVGKQRADVIRPLAEQGKCSRASILEAANALQLSERYIYRLIRKCRASQGILTSLIPEKPNGGKGRSRLLNQQESLIYEVIEDLYLTPQKLSPARIVEEVRKQCVEKIIEIPSEATIRRRLSRLLCSQLKIRGENTVSTEPDGRRIKFPTNVAQNSLFLRGIIKV